MLSRNWRYKILACVSLAFGLASSIAVDAQDPSVAFVTFGSSDAQHNVDCREVLLDPLKDTDSAPVITALVASGDGHFIAAAGDDHAIRIINAESGETIRTLIGHTDWIQTLVFSSDGHTLFSSGNDGRVLSWDYRFPVTLSEIIKLPYAVRSLSTSTANRLLAIGGFANKIIVWDLESARVKYRLHCECGDQRCVKFSPDGNQMLCGGRDGEVRIWNVRTGALIVAFKKHQGRVYTAAFSSDGSTVTSVAEDRRLIQYDLATKQASPKGEMARSKLMSMCMINDDLVAVAGADNSIHLYDVLADKVVAHLRGHSGTVAVMAPCGESLISGSFDTTIRIWNLASIDAERADYGKPVSYAPMKMDSRLRIR